MLWRYSETTVDSYGFLQTRYFQQTQAHIDLREMLMDFPNQSIITRDNVQISVHPMLLYRIEDPVRAVYEAYDLAQCVENLVQTTLRAIIGDMGLDDTLASREEINRILSQKIRFVSSVWFVWSHSHSHICFNWGLRLVKVDLLEITPTGSIMAAMHKQLKVQAH